MIRSRFATFALLAALLWGAASLAVDPPHWSNAYSTIDCTSCHTGHSAPGGTLTAAAGNVNLCQSCHNPSGQAMDLPLDHYQRATPGQGGTSHSFDAPAVNANYGAAAPTQPEMNLRVMDGKIVCSTCHDQHAAASSLGGSPKVSVPEKKVSLGGTGTMAASGTFTGTNGLWYLVDITVGGAVGTSRFRISKDRGVTWLGWSGAWVPYTSSPENGKFTAASTALDNGLTASFANGGGPIFFAAGERWQFYASWPFMRVAQDSGDNAAGAKFCRDCHSAWTMDAAAVETYDGSYKSHPVGEALARSYDRASPLDGNGQAQAGGDPDGNPSNNLRLDSTNRIQCLSCHGAHYADSNTATVDGP